MKLVGVEPVRHVAPCTNPFVLNQACDSRLFYNQILGAPNVETGTDWPSLGRGEV